MGTEKRERQKANRAMRQVEQAKAAKQSQTKRNVLRWGAAIVAAFAAVVVIAWVGGAFDSDDDAITTATLPPTLDSTISDAFATTVPGDTATTVEGDPASDTANDPASDPASDPDGDDCPATDGSEEQRQEFTGPQPMCIDPAKTYTAEIVTTEGPITIELLADKAPTTVNNFVTLARYHYYDDVPCHRIIPGFMAQCGDPTGTGSGGPGYAFEDELPEAGEYQIGSIAMANSG
ncbi:MAG TPA: peptidylprolyl isomerase, partial [Ilumatobacter sp.]|nr:peptidylprolyl isomerase [Ilumatobacter sp.]